MLAMPHRREATWQTTARPDLGATFARVGANGYVRVGVVIL